MFPPRRRRNENVTRTARLLPHVIALAEHRAPDARRSRWPTSPSPRTPAASTSCSSPPDAARPARPHALEAATQTPPLARFLAEVASARFAAYKPFDFGAAARLPYLPRVRYRRTILTPARWLLTAEDLPGPNATPAAWENAFDAWRDRLRARTPHMIEQDQRLPLDLTHPVHRPVLRAQLDSTRRLELREVPDPGARGWIGRAHELLLPLPSPSRPPPPTAEAAARHPGDAAHLWPTVPFRAAPRPPGPLRRDPDQHLPLSSARRPPAAWWFTRQRGDPPDADQYLDLALHLPDRHLGPAAERSTTGPTPSTAGLAPT